MIKVEFEIDCDTYSGKTSPSWYCPHDGLCCHQTQVETLKVKLCFANQFHRSHEQEHQHIGGGVRNRPILPWSALHQQVSCQSPSPTMRIEFRNIDGKSLRISIHMLISHYNALLGEAQTLTGSIDLLWNLTSCIQRWILIRDGWNDWPEVQHPQRGRRCLWCRIQLVLRSAF